MMHLGLRITGLFEGNTPLRAAFCHRWNCQASVGLVESFWNCAGARGRALSHSFSHETAKRKDI